VQGYQALNLWYSRVYKEIAISSNYNWTQAWNHNSSVIWTGSGDVIALLPVFPPQVQVPPVAQAFHLLQDQALNQLRGASSSKNGVPSKDGEEGKSADDDIGVSSTNSNDEDKDLNGEVIYICDFNLVN
jgi:hypothetical protein